MGNNASCSIPRTMIALNLHTCCGTEMVLATLLDLKVGKHLMLILSIKATLTRVARLTQMSLIVTGRLEARLDIGYTKKTQHITLFQVMQCVP